MTFLLNNGDHAVINDWLVEFVGACTCDTPDPRLYGHRAECGFEPLTNLAGMDRTERVAVLLDATAALGTPEVVYRRNHGESMADAATRLRAEVMEKARDVLRVADAEIRS